MAKYIVTKAQVEEMYKESVGNWRAFRDNPIDLVLYKTPQGKVSWAFVKGKLHEKGEVIYRQEANGLFEWVILKEVGGRRQYTKQELIDGIQDRIHRNYIKSL